MKNKRTEILLLGITALNVLCLFFNFSNRASSREAQQATALPANNTIIQKQIQLSEDAWVDENAKIVFDDKLKKEVLPLNQPYLALRFSFRNCDVCTKNAFDNLQVICDSLGLDKKHVRLLGTFFNDRDSLLFKSRTKLPYDLVALPDNGLGLQLEQDPTYPFLFVLFPDGSARHVFVPLKEDVQRTRTYLSIIHRKYFKDEG